MLQVDLLTPKSKIKPTSPLFSEPIHNQNNNNNGSNYYRELVMCQALLLLRSLHLMRQVLFLSPFSIWGHEGQKLSNLPVTEQTHGRAGAQTLSV